MNRITRDKDGALGFRFHERALFLLCALAISICLWSDTSCVAAASADTKEVTSDSASLIRLEETEGTVSVTDSVGVEMSTSSRMRLFSGNHVETKVKSYAIMSLDEAKAVKLDALSESEVRKDGKKLQILLDRGNLFFEVSEPLAQDEVLHIRTSTIVMGIRGTCGIVKELSPTRTQVAILEGEVECIISNPETGIEKSVILHAGDIAEFVALPLEKCEKKEDTSKILVRKMNEDDVDGFALIAILSTEGLAEKILEASGLDFTEITTEDAKKRLARDQKELEEELAVIDAAVVNQNRNTAVDPVWPGGDDAAAVASTAGSTVSTAATTARTADTAATNGSTNTESTGASGTGSTKSKSSTNAATGSNSSATTATTAKTGANTVSTGSNSSAVASTTSKTGANTVSTGSTSEASGAASTKNTGASSNASSTTSTASTAASAASTDSSEDEGTGYRIIVDDSITGGTVKTDKKRAEYKSNVTITVTPDSGYRLTRLSCQSLAAASEQEIFTFDIQNGGGEATYLMGMGWEEDVLVKAEFSAR